MKGDRQCEQCGRWFSSGSFKSHQEKQHARCRDCGQLLSGTGVQQHSCRLNFCCGKAFKDKAYKRHRNKPHFPCRYCETSWLLSKKPHHDRNCEPRREHSRIIHDAIKHYKKEARSALKTSIRSATHFQHVTPPRIHQDAKNYTTILEGAEIGEPITADEYIEGSSTKTGKVFVICTYQEARMILKQGPPRLPILIPVELNDGTALLKIDEYLNVLETKPTLDIHDFATNSKSTLPSASAISRFKDSSKGAINIVNLRGYKQNPVPGCLAHLLDYALLESIPEQRSNVMEEKLCDFTDSARFQLLANAGAFSFPHVDRHGVIKAVFTDFGETLWLLWPHKSLSDLTQSCGALGEFEKDAVSLYLKTGSLLIQPSATLHAPFSMTSVLMTGTKYVHSSNILAMLKQTEAEMKYATLTSEDFYAQFVSFMENVLQLWKERLGPWTWGCEDDLKESSILLQRIKAQRLKR